MFLFNLSLFSSKIVLLKFYLACKKWNTMLTSHCFHVTHVWRTVGYIWDIFESWFWFLHHKITLCQSSESIQIPGPIQFLTVDCRIINSTCQSTCLQISYKWFQIFLSTHSLPLCVAASFVRPTTFVNIPNVSMSVFYITTPIHHYSKNE